MRDSVQMNIRELIDRIDPRYRKVVLGCSVCFLVLIVALSALIASSLYNKKTYLQADELLQAKNYAAAAELYESITNYRDSNDKFYQCKYLLAYQCLELAKYSEASKRFAAIGEYKNSSALKSYCDKMESFEEINTLVADGKYQEAYVWVEDMPVCAERARILSKIVQETDFVQTRDESQNEGNFFSITGIATGVDYEVWSGEKYLEVKFDNYSNAHACCRDLSEEDRSSVQEGDRLTLVGVLTGDNNYDFFDLLDDLINGRDWDGIFFDSCSIIPSADLQEKTPLSQLLDVYNAFQETNQR